MEIESDPWEALDDLRDHVEHAPVIEPPAGTFNSLAEARAALGGLVPTRLVFWNWELYLSRRRQGGQVLWHLSAKFPASGDGRVPKPKDFEAIRRIATRVGWKFSSPLLAYEFGRNASHAAPRAMFHWTWHGPCGEHE